MDEEVRREQIKRVIETVAEGALMINAGGIIIYANNSAEKILGLKRNDIVGRTYSDPGYKVTTLDGKPYPIEKRPITQVLQTGELVQNVEYVIERPDGTRVIVAVNASPLRDEKGTILGVILSFTDITARKKAEAELRASEKKLRDITSVLGEGVYVLDKKGHLTFMNPEAERLLGWTEAELYGKNVHEAIHYQRADGSIFPASECPVLKIINSGGIYRTDDDVFTRKDGSMLPVAYVTTPILENGKVVDSVTTFQDITERKKIERLRDALNRINAAISSTLNFDEIMRRIVVDSVKGMGSERTIILLHEDGYWVVRYTYGFPKVAVGSRLNDDEARHAVLAANTRKLVIVNDTYSDERVNRKVMERLGTRSVLTVPLVVREKVIGVLCFCYSTKPVAFTDAQADFASKLAVSISLALENARLYSIEKNIADTLQEALLTMPKNIEGIDFGYLYHSATDTARVGGDFYDIFELEHNKVGMAVGDVSGHGLEASTLTALVKSTIRAYAYDNSSPAVIMAKTNEAIIKASAQELFITVFFGILDMKAEVLTYCSAGHPPAIVKRKTSETFFLTTDSPAIGAFSGLNYFNNQETIKKGDTLIIYTDGVIEARCNNRFFGDERLIRFVNKLKPIPAREIPRAIFNRVIDCAGGILSDDVAILTVSLD